MSSRNFCYPASTSTSKSASKLTSAVFPWCRVPAPTTHNQLGSNWVAGNHSSQEPFHLKIRIWTYRERMNESMKKKKAHKVPEPWLILGQVEETLNWVDKNKRFLWIMNYGNACQGLYWRCGVTVGQNKEIAGRQGTLVHNCSQLHGTLVHKPPVPCNREIFWTQHVLLGILCIVGLFARSSFYWISPAFQDYFCIYIHNLF